MTAIIPYSILGLFICTLIICFYGVVQYRAVRKYKQLAATYKAEAQSYRANIALRGSKPKETVMVLSCFKGRSCRNNLYAFREALQVETRKGTWILQDRQGAVYWQSQTRSTFVPYVESAFPDKDVWSENFNITLVFQPK